jgi:hypothetical protein
LANPYGRPTGSRNKRTEAIWAKLEKRGDLDPVEYMSSLVANPKTPPELRLAAATALAPYRHSKCGLTPQPVPLVYVEHPVELPHPRTTCVAHTLANIEHISALRRTGKLDQDTADRLVAEQRILRDGLIEEAKLLVAQGGPREQTIRVEGGLPPLPGTNVDMSSELIAVVNGAAVREGTILPPVPVIPHPESPLAQKPGPPEAPAEPAKPGGDDRS